MAAVAATLVLTMGATASAATATHHGARQAAVATPATSGNAWADRGDSRYMYYDSSAGVFITEASEGTLIGTATACDGSGDCEHKLPDGKCMEWESGPNTVSEGTCSGIPRQLWSISSVGGGYYTWTNEYANALFQQKNYCHTTGGDAAPFLTANSAGLYMRCGLASGYAPSYPQEWS